MKPAPWRVVGSETIIADRWIRLRADDCRDAQGRTIAPYYVLEHRDWISLLALTPGGDAILVDEYRHGAGIVAPGAIGGVTEPGESPADAARRELREETGYEAGELVDLGATWANFGSHTNRVHHFLASGCARVTDQTLDDTETIDVLVAPFEGVESRLSQSYHLLTWFKAQAHLNATQNAE